MKYDHLNFKDARKAFDENDSVGMKEFAGELNKILVTSIWYNETEGIEELLDKTGNMMEQVRLRNDLHFEKDYFYGFVWGIENMARNILLRKEDFSEIDQLARQTKHLNKILSFLRDQDIVQHKELADHLDISPSALTNFFVNNNLERLKIIHIERIGKATYYSLTNKGEKYLDVKRQKQSGEMDEVINFLEKMKQNVMQDSENWEFGYYDSLDKEKRQKLQTFIKDIFEFNVISKIEQNTRQKRNKLRYSNERRDCVPQDLAASA